MRKRVKAWISQVLMAGSLLMLAACHSNPHQEKSASSAEADAVPIHRVETDGTPKLAWTDSLVTDYIRHTPHMQEPELRDSLTYFFDRREVSDTAHYLIFQVGHSFENNFITDRWLYLDSTRRVLFEYDPVADSLMRWTK